MHYDCLIVDDEEALGQSTNEYFNLFDINTTWVSGVKECLQFLENNSTDLILLDINLGDESGFSLCKKLRAEYDMPILFISARNSDDDILLALGIGGDDYIAKPFSLSILLAKVKAVLKRYRGDNITEKDDNQIYEFGRFSIDFSKERLTADGIEIKLKAMEYKLLAYLIKNRNCNITKEEIFRNVWEDAITTDGTLNVHIRRLREKIEENPNEPDFIKTMWGTGYRFEVLS